MARSYQFVVGQADAGARLDRYLTHRLPDSVSRAMIQRGIQAGGIVVGGRPVKAHYKLRPGDTVTAGFRHLPAPARDLPLIPQPIPLDVVYEDRELLVVHKPAGLVTHPAPGHWDGTLVNAVLWHLQQERAAEEGDHELPRAGIVHRLDKETSGLLLVAKTAHAQLSLARQLKARTIHRRYLAVVEGRVPLESGTVNVPIGRHLTHRKEMTVRHLGGRAAVTHYRVLRRMATPMDCTVLDVSLETGRTHQIRVHMAHLGHPVLGDTTYGKRPAEFWRSAGIGRHLLHAYRLSFQHPVTHRPVVVSAPVPDDMATWCDRTALQRLDVK